MERSLLTGAWLPQFGEFHVEGSNTLRVRATWPVGGGFHAEAHHGGVLGADFRYSALLFGDWTNSGLSTHLWFRISDEGRYGVRIQGGLVVLYRFMLEDRACAPPDSNVIAHCPLWDPDADDPEEVPLASRTFDPGVGSLRVSVDAVGPRLSVSFGTVSTELGRFEAEDDSLGVGRFGVYVLSGKEGAEVVFRDLVATADPTAASNFALLYSTPGHDATGTKRLLVRTINPVDPSDISVPQSSFTVLDKHRKARFSGRFRSPSAYGLGRAFGMQVLEGEFSGLQDAGTFTLEASIATSNGVRVLHSGPFEICSRLVSETMLWPMTIANAQARRAADEDFRRNWQVESGPQCWSVGLDGAFMADRADDQAGATLRRVFDGNNGPLYATEFRFACQLTIVRGCDAQLQFWIGDRERWGVTLQAGDAGGCAHGAGPGAVRLHREGLDVDPPKFFDPVASHLLDVAPFQVGRAYDVEVRAEYDQFKVSRHVEVLLDGLPVIDCTCPGEPPGGGFALKAWASTVRFEHAQVWARSVKLSHPWPGVWIPYYPITRLSSQGLEITAPDLDPIADSSHEHDVEFPYAAQQHGFLDCNSAIGEVTSHGVFLAALMAVWQVRASDVAAADQDLLRESILTAVLYLYELYEQGNRSGAFAHQEPGRGALSKQIDPILTTRFALYGLSSFAEAGLVIDGSQARRAFDLAAEGWNWLDRHGGRDAVFDSVIAIRMAVAAERQGRPADDWFRRAHDYTKSVLAVFSQPDAMANMQRPTLRSIPWFEGVYETFTKGRLRLEKIELVRVAVIADQLEALLNDPANAFHIVPQSDEERNPQDPDWPARNWNDMADLPLAFYPIPSPALGHQPVGDWYVCTHFLTAAADCVYIGRLASRDALEPLATGNLSWALGLNPGIPTTKVIGAPQGSGPWSAASFVYNGPGAFARTIEGWRTRVNSAKTWLSWWEESSGSRHRETWPIDFLNNGFQSVVNGHVLREGQWHYWSNGINGWVSGETFMLDDGLFLRAALALEDWRDQTQAATTNPYDRGRLRFFDTTHLDRAGTSWLFDDPEFTDWAQAQRMATDFAAGKGFGGGRLTGHHIGERVGVLCLPGKAASFTDIFNDEIGALNFSFNDINTANWAQIGRAAVEIAVNRHFGAGYFTGHQLPDRRGWIGLKPELISVFDLDNRDPSVMDSDWRFPDIDIVIDTVPWAQAARLATDVCIRKGFAGGFFTGNYLPGIRQVVAFIPS
jgi:hypothetical protein